MHAWILDQQAPVGQRPLRLVERAPPEPRAGEAVVRVRACGVCRTDLHVVEGDLPLRKRPLVPGHQVVGIVETVGAGVQDVAAGERVGVAWVHATCGTCRFCRSERENLCTQARFTGWTDDGGFAELLTAPAAFLHRLPARIDDLDAAPLLCAGIIGYRALRLVDPAGFPASLRGMQLGIYGFGAAGHVMLQVARAFGADVHVCTRDRERHQSLAAELGARSVGDATDPPPVRLDAAVLFAPAGELVPVALQALDRGGRLVLGGIHMSDTPPLPYELLYEERVVCSVMNNTRQDARELLALAAELPIHTHVQTYPLQQADDALIALQHDAVRGAAVLINEA